MREKIILGAEESGLTLAAALRGRIPELSWSKARAMCTRGQVSLDGEQALDPAARVSENQQLDVDVSRPSPGVQGRRARLIHTDAHLVVFNKPAGMPTVPSERGEQGTALDTSSIDLSSVEKTKGRIPLFVVHRLDKETSGLIVFARNRKVERALGSQFRAHTIERSYVAVAHGQVAAQRIESQIVADRGDGLRGSDSNGDAGQRAVTHVKVVEALDAATLLEVQLETGRTHQIRIHLSEAGSPIVGDRVYTRDYIALGYTPLPSSRMMLHAATLGFEHPVTGKQLRFESPLPKEFSEGLAQLRS